MEEDKRNLDLFNQENDNTGKIEPDYNYDFSFDKKVEDSYLNEREEKDVMKFSSISSVEERKNELDQNEGMNVFQKEESNPYIKEETKPLFAETKESLEKNYTPNIEPVDIELNRENIMEEALSHTTKYSPFVLPKEEEQEEPEKENKGSVVFIIVLFAILFLAVLLIPKISTWF